MICPNKRFRPVGPWDKDRYITYYFTSDIVWWIYAENANIFFFNVESRLFIGTNNLSCGAPLNQQHQEQQDYLLQRIKGIIVGSEGLYLEIVRFAQSCTFLSAYGFIAFYMKNCILYKNIIRNIGGSDGNYKWKINANK